MATKHFVFRTSNGIDHLAKVEGGGTFAPDGAKVLAITLADDVTHLVNIGAGNWDVKDGLVLIRSSDFGDWARTYRDWVYVEERPYKAPSPVRVSRVR